GGAQPADRRRERHVPGRDPGGRDRQDRGARAHDRQPARGGVRRADNAPLLLLRGQAEPPGGGARRRRADRRVAEALRARGIEVREVNAGGSFTGKFVAEVPGITESRAGTYVFYDVMHVNEGSATEDQLALTALCRVVSRWGEDGLTIDGGAETVSGGRGVGRGGDRPGGP